MKQNTKTVLMNVANSAAFTTPTITVVTGTVDTFGFRYASISAFSESTSGLNTTVANNLLTESDTSGGTYVSIAAAVAGAAFTPTSASQSTSLAKVTYNVDLRGRKRYLGCTLGLGTASGAAQLICTLSQPVDGVVTAAEQGAAFISTT